jgi:hypothetical protein
MYTTRRGGFDRDDARLHYEQLQKRKYVLTLFANTGGTASLPYDTMEYALQMRQAFMNTGDYRDAKIEALS